MVKEGHGCAGRCPNEFQVLIKLDKQLRAVDLQVVLEKRRLEQALNAKEFAVLAGVSYSTARQWLRLAGFPVFRGVVFWQDFVLWRNIQTGLCGTGEKITVQPKDDVETSNGGNDGFGLFPRAARILAEAGR